MTASNFWTNQPNVNVPAKFSAKRAGKTGSHLVFVLDDSQSMQKCRESTISGFNEYLQGQLDDAMRTGISTAISLYKFDGTGVVRVLDRVDVSEAPKLTAESYDPRGMTNLLDGIGSVMVEINGHLAGMPKADRPSVIITILTDGQENASRTYTNECISLMVKKAEEKNWGFMFLGANINAFATGASLGFSGHNTLQYDVGSMGDTMRSASSMASRMKTAYSTGVPTDLAYTSAAFTDVERATSVDNGPST